MKHMRTDTRGFTLIELLIVIGLLGALATLMIPMLRVDKVKSTESIVKSEMYDIQRTFVRFYNDCEFCTGRVSRVSSDGIYGWTNVYLAPLLMQVGTNEFNYERWDSAKNRGWRGPYAISEGTNAAGYRALLDPYGDPYEVVVSNYPSGKTNLFLLPSQETCALIEVANRNDLARQLTFDE